MNPEMPVGARFRRGIDRGGSEPLAGTSGERRVGVFMPPTFFDVANRSPNDRQTASHRASAAPPASRHRTPDSGEAYRLCAGVGLTSRVEGELRVSYVETSRPAGN